jgi:hypothetical protein
LKKKPSLSNSDRNKRQTARGLEELQRTMARAVMRPLAADGGMKSKWIDGRPMTKVAARFIKPNDRLDSFERLEIYNRQYWYRLKDCFYDDYPGLRALLGESRFERLACAYLDRNPSTSFTMRNLGRRLVGFLQAEPRWTAPEQEIALDMARLEWAHVEAFDNEALPPLTTDSLLGLAPEKIILKLQPHITLLRLCCNADQLLIEAQRGRDLNGQASNAIEARKRRRQLGLRRRLKKGVVCVAVHRNAGSVFYKRLTEPQFCLLSALNSGVAFGHACEALAASESENPSLGAEIAKWFETWASLGWFRQLA